MSKDDIIEKLFGEMREERAEHRREMAALIGSLSAPARAPTDEEQRARDMPWKYGANRPAPLRQWTRTGIATLHDREGDRAFQVATACTLQEHGATDRCVEVGETDFSEA